MKTARFSKLIIGELKKTLKSEEIFIQKNVGDLTDIQKTIDAILQVEDRSNFLNRLSLLELTLPSNLKCSIKRLSDACKCIHNYIYSKKFVIETSIDKFANQPICIDEIQKLESGMIIDCNDGAYNYYIEASLDYNTCYIGNTCISGGIFVSFRKLGENELLESVAILIDPSSYPKKMYISNGDNHCKRCPRYDELKQFKIDDVDGTIFDQDCCIMNKYKMDQCYLYCETVTPDIILRVISTCARLYNNPNKVQSSTDKEIVHKIHVPTNNVYDDKEVLLPMTEYLKPTTERRDGKGGHHRSPIPHTVREHKRWCPKSKRYTTVKSFEKGKKTIGRDTVYKIK